jgi:hypothetical protein
MNRNQFKTYLTNAHEGDRIKYHEGSLARERQKDSELTALADIVWSAFEHGKGYPYQRQSYKPGKLHIYYFKVERND